MTQNSLSSGSHPGSLLQTSVPIKGLSDSSAAAFLSCWARGTKNGRGKVESTEVQSTGRRALTDGARSALYCKTGWQEALGTPVQLRQSRLCLWCSEQGGRRAGVEPWAATFPISRPYRLSILQTLSPFSPNFTDQLPVLFQSP